MIFNMESDFGLLVAQTARRQIVASKKIVRSFFTIAGLQGLKL